MVTAIQTKNDNIRKLLGVDTWHKKGYTGTRGLSISLESDTTDHGSRVKAVFHEIAPDRELVCISLNGIVDDRFFDKAINEIIARGADTCTRSQNGARDGNAFEKVKDFCTCFNSAGNDGMEDDSHCNSIIAPYVYGVGAVTIKSLTDITPTYYTSKSQYVDFAAPADFYVFGYTQTGTSFATPCVAAMAALVNDLFIYKTGRPLSSDDMYRFLKDNSRDVGEKGKDTKSGWGVPILPDPDTIDIWKYQEKPNEETKKEEENTGYKKEVKTEVKIVETDWRWAYPLSYRSKVEEVIFHHAAADGSAESVHEYHKRRGYAGIAYNYYVRKNGEIYRGRPENTIGEHTSARNDKSIGICFEGNFEIEPMPEAQKRAGCELVADIKSRHPGIKFFRHRDVDVTACPGRNFPFEEMKNYMSGQQIYNELASFSAEREESEWSKKEGHWARATELEIVDGTSPRGFVSREQLIAILGRMGLFEGMGKGEE